MPPIRKGDGTPVTPKGISQIRTGDGRILFDGVAIPDSASHRWTLEEDSSTFVDSIGSSDATNQGTTRTTNTWQGGAARQGNGSDQYIEHTQLGDFGSNLDGPWGIAYTVETTSNSRGRNGVLNDGSNTAIRLAINGPSEGDIEIWLRDDNGDINAVSASLGVNDGEKHRVFHRVTGTSANDYEIWENNSEQSVNVDTNEGASNFSNFEYDFTTFGWNSRGTIDDNYEGVLDDIIIYSDPSTDDIQTDYNLQTWV